MKRQAWLSIAILGLLWPMPVQVRAESGNVPGSQLFSGENILIAMARDNDGSIGMSEPLTLLARGLSKPSRPHEGRHPGVRKIVSRGDDQVRLFFGASDTGDRRKGQQSCRASRMLGMAQSTSRQPRRLPRPASSSPRTSGGASSSDSISLDRLKHRLVWGHPGTASPRGPCA